METRDRPIFRLSVLEGASDSYRSTGIYLNTEHAVAGDYVAFMADVLSIIQHLAASAFEDDSGRVGRTLRSGFVGVGSVQVSDETGDIAPRRSADIL